MEVSSFNRSSILINKNNQKSNKNQASVNNQSNPGFKGGIDIVTKPCTWLVEHMEASKAVEFCLLDVVSTILPRVYFGFKRNQEELGHPNYKVATEVALREFSTGPGMVLLPALFMGLCGKLAGKAADLQFNTIDKLSNIFKNSANKTGNAIENFYKAVLEKAFNGDNKIKPEDLPELNKIQDNLVKFAKKSTSKTDKKEAKKAIENKLVELNKKFNLKTPDVIDFGDGLKMKASKVANNLTAYAEGIVEKVKKNKDFSEEAIKKATKWPVIGRAMCIASALLATSAFLWYSPKIYQRSKEYPGLEGLNKKNNNRK